MVEKFYLWNYYLWSAFTLADKKKWRQKLLIYTVLNYVIRKLIAPCFTDNNSEVNWRSSKSSSRILPRLLLLHILGTTNKLKLRTPLPFSSVFSCMMVQRLGRCLPDRIYSDQLQFTFRLLYSFRPLGSVLFFYAVMFLMSSRGRTRVRIYTVTYVDIILYRTLNNDDKTKYYGPMRTWKWSVKLAIMRMCTAVIQ